MTLLIASPASPVTVYYCKAGLQTGRTIRVLQAGTVHEAAEIAMRGATATMAHDNSSGKPKRSGARCVLVITSGTVGFK